MWEDNDRERRWGWGADSRDLRFTQGWVLWGGGGRGKGLPGEEGDLEGLSAHLPFACKEGQAGGQWGDVMLGTGSCGAGRLTPALPPALSARENWGREHVAEEASVAASGPT